MKIPIRNGLGLGSVTALQNRYQTGIGSAGTDPKIKWDYTSHLEVPITTYATVLLLRRTASFASYPDYCQSKNMFTLWYTVLSYKEYRNTIWDKLCSKKAPGAKETAVVCPLPPKKNEPPSRIPVVEPPKSSRTPSPQVPASPPSPQPQARPPPPSQKPQTPVSKPKSSELPSPPPQKIEPPPKPPRSPSPHPIRAEAFDDIEYDDESEESSEPEEEENSVLVTPQRKPVAKSVNEFIDREKAT